MKHQIDQQNLTTDDRFPEYLLSYVSLEQHFRGQLASLTKTEKGDKFAHFVQRLIPQTEVGSDFLPPRLHQKKSHDEGVDLIAESRDGGSILYIQARMWIDRAAEIDSIVSSFQAYSSKYHLDKSGQQYRFTVGDVIPHFLVVTLSSLKGILKRYEQREFSSKDFYKECVKEGRLHFVDGPTILYVLQASYRKIGELPTDMVLNLETAVIPKGNVFVGIISSVELRKLYEQFGDALFFENIRDFLGSGEGQERIGRTTPNAEIIKTIAKCPDKMLERNNGVVFRADRVDVNDSGSQLLLSRGSVVNGCQTTMCLIKYAEETCYVPVKVVQTSDSWDIAKAANLQNVVFDIDLDLARHLRPQLAKRAATALGVQLDDGEKSAFQIMDEIYGQRVAYEETRLLFIGFFSRTPNNIFARNYTELMPNLIDKFYLEDPYGERIFDFLFVLQAASQEGLEEAKTTFTDPAYAGLFKRYYREDSPTYRCFVSVLAICGAVGMNIVERKTEVLREYERVGEFLHKAHDVFENQKEEFLRYYKLAVLTWMLEVSKGADDVEAQRDMRSRSERINFKRAYANLCAQADLRM